MPAYRPRSIVSLILVGFAVVLAPFVIAVVTAVIQVDHFAIDGRSTVINVGAAIDESRAVVEEITEMQRALGQYAIRGDRDFFDSYLDRRELFRAALGNLIALDVRGLDAQALGSLADDEAAIHEQITQTDASAQEDDWQTAIDSLATLALRSRSLRSESEELVRQRANDVTIRAESLQRTLLVIAAAAAPATVVLVAVFTVLITRPMRSLGSAIRGLGARTLDQPITVTGPRDIEALADELELLRLRIKALEDQKASFLQHISHELKTPLATIREGSELLTETLNDDRSEEAEIARLLQRNGLQLQQLIEDLLQFARTQDLALDLKFRSAVDLADVIGESISALTVVSDARELVIETRLPSVVVRCDAGKVRTVMDNLLTNAIKYTPDGGRVDVRLSLEGSDAIIDVFDSGPGVAVDERQRIFEPFRQGTAEYQSSVKGTGLGLSIAREYVEAHGGQLELVDSDGGAHFKVILPVAGPAGVASD